MTADPFAKYLTPQPTQSSAPGDDPFAKYTKPQAPPSADNAFDTFVKGTLHNIGAAAQVVEGGVKGLHSALLDSEVNAAQGAVNLLGGAQRAVGETAAQFEHGATPQSGDAVWHAFWDASPEQNARSTEAIRALLHAPTHEAVTKWANSVGGLDDTEKQWLANIAMGTEDTALQMGSDPLTLADGLGLAARLAGMAIHGAQALRAMSAAARSVGMGKAFAHLTNSAGHFAQGETAAQVLARQIRNVGIRPELDPIFTLDGKRMRIHAIENKWFNRIGQAQPAEDALFDAFGKAQEDFTRLSTQIGTPEQMAAARMTLQQSAASVKNLYLEYLYRTASPEDRALLTKEFGVHIPDAPQYAQSSFDADAELEAIRARFVRKGKVPSDTELQEALADKRADYEIGRTKALRNDVASFMNGSPDEMLQQIRGMRATFRDFAINAETKALVGRDPSLLKPGVDPSVIDSLKSSSLDQKNIIKTRNDLVRNLSQGVNSIIGKMGGFPELTRKLSRASIMVKPWIHELRNVGQLARMGGGLHMVPYGIYHALRDMRGMAADDIARLDRMGGLPTFFHDISGEWLGKVPVLGALQKAAQHLDVGYRIALMKTLDKVEGPSREMAVDAVTREYQAAKKATDTPEFLRDVQTRTAENEYLKGASVQERIGDPRNQDAIIRLFEAFGGYYPVFRLGIVPRNVLAALLEHPSRVILPLREQANYNADKPEDGTLAVAGGPTTDAAEMGRDTMGAAFGMRPGYFVSASTSGVVGQVLSPNEGDVGVAPWTRAAQIGANLVPFGYDAEDISKMLTGKDPSAPPELRDKILLSLWNFLTGNYSRTERNPYVQASDERRLDTLYPGDNSQ